MWRGGFRLEHIRFRLWRCVDRRESLTPLQLTMSMTYSADRRPNPTPIHRWRLRMNSARSRLASTGNWLISLPRRVDRDLPGIGVLRPVFQAIELFFARNEIPS